ncbi:MAG: hypothetical protein GY757_54665 [bacterium]|nr:hypothetical protein [bacterium]
MTQLKEDTILSKTEIEKLELYKNALKVAWGFGDKFDWPVKINSIFHLFLEEFGEELIEDLTYLEEQKKLTPEEIAGLFYNPARLFRMIEYTIYALRKKRSSIQNQRKIALKLLAMVKELKYGSEFNEDSRNIIYSPEKVETIFQKFFAGKKCSLTESRLIHRFCGVTWAYTESLFFRAHGVTKELHGPYPFKNGNLLVKEYRFLNPVEIWPDISMPPCKHVKVFKYYNEKINMKVDSLNHLEFVGNDPPVPNLENYYMEIDGREAHVDLVEELLAHFGRAITEISKKIKGMTWNERVAKYAGIFWFMKKPLRDARNQDWKVPQKVLVKIATGKPLPGRTTKLSHQQVQRLAQLSI